MKKRLFTFFTLLLCVCSGAWGALTLPSIPAGTLDLSSQTTFTPDANGWIVFNPYASFSSSAPTYWTTNETTGNTGRQWTVPDGTTAPFAGQSGSNAKVYQLKNATGTYALRFTGATNISVLAKGNSSSRKAIIALYSYDGESQTTAGEPQECTNTVTELKYTGLTSSTNYILYMYSNDDGGWSDMYEIALKGTSGGGSSTYTVTYNGNGNTGGSVPTDSDSPYEEGATVTVLGNTGSLTKTSYEWAGWNTNAQGDGTNYSADDTFEMGTSNVVLYAKWNQTAPIINTHPVSASYYSDGTPVDLTVAATAASGSLTYQWYTNTTGTADPANDDEVAEATTATLAAAKLAFVADETHYYYCVVNDDSNNPIVSNVAKIAVFAKLSGYPDTNYLELDGNTSSGSITFTKSSKYTRQGNACTFYGKAYTNGLKQESDTRTTFTTTEYSTITIAQPLTSNSDKTIVMNVDDGSFTELSAWANCTVTTYSDNSNLNYQKVKIYKITNCAAGTYIVKQGSGQSFVAYIGITYTPKTGTTVDTGAHDPYYANNSNATGYFEGVADELTFDGIGTLTGTNMQSGSTLLTVDGNTYTSIKAARGSTHVLTPADGVTITGVTLYATSNHATDAAIITTGAGDTNITTSNNNTTPTSVALTKNGEGKYYFTVSNSSANFQALVVLKISYTTTENIDVTVSSAGYATLYYDKKLTIPAGVTVYKAAVKDASTITITPLEGTVIPANTGVILKADAGTYNFVVTDAAATAVEGNILTGATTATAVSANTVYTLGQNSEGVVGLRLYSGTSIRAYSAYATSIAATAPSFLGFEIGNEGETTGIGAIEHGTWNIEHYYDLQGRRVAQPTKGLYIVNGKKVVVK